MKDINSVQSGIVQENSVNDPGVRTYKGKNQFPQSFQHPSTCLYGYIDPVAVAKCEVGDIFPYKFVTDLNTFTMKSPLKSEVKMYSAAFKVPMEAIYPRTYKYLFSFAQKGDEVPQAQPTSSGFGDSERAIFPVRSFVGHLFSFLKSIYDSAGNYDDYSQIYDYYVRSILLLESIFSDGSIFAKMNIHLCSALFDVQGHYVSGSHNNSLISFDEFFDSIFYPSFISVIDFVAESGSYFYIQHRSASSDEPEGYPEYFVTMDASLWNKPVSSDITDEYYGIWCSPDRCLELMRTGDWRIFFDYSNMSEEDIFSNVPYLSLSEVRSQSLPLVLNIEPIIAYQLACVHFFNNPKIDYLYTAQLWRDNLQSIAMPITGILSFDYNGTEVLSDIVSFKYLNIIIDYIDLHEDSDIYGAFDYYYHLFSFQRSLRYGDYFTGSRPEPIGVGDINLEENSSGNVDSLEVARKLQLTRLLHKVAITGPEHSQQVKYIFGGNLPDVPTDVPIRLSLEEFDVEGFETNNTGTAQLSDDNPNITTTNLRLSDSKFMFEVEVNEPCWLVMVQYFEAHRIYANTIDRFAYHYDLYDDFVPDMQFIGDQDVKQSELLGVFGDQFSPFAYHLRNMEYKQRVSYASGGFIRMLPSWAFITDNQDGNPAFRHISPEYIRSSPSEFDRFYKSLTGHSLGSRFHFITMNTNVMAPYRQMVFSPEILV